MLTGAPFVDLWCSSVRLRLYGSVVIRSHGEVGVVLMCGRGCSGGEKVLKIAESEASATGNAKLQAAATTCAGVC